LFSLDELREKDAGGTNRILLYIPSVEWRFAKTMPLIPHWYTVREWNKQKRDDFTFLVRFIREHGEVIPWGRFMNTYLKLGVWKYWTMGAPIEETTVINRAIA